VSSGCKCRSVFVKQNLKINANLVVSKYLLCIHY